MKILFCRSNTFVSWAIRLLTWSEFSHVVLVTPTGTCIEATWPRVHEVTRDFVNGDNDVVVEVELPCLDPVEATWWARGQIGKPYDWRALLGFLIHRDWTEGQHWFCSELVAAAFEEGGMPLFRAQVLSRVTPQAVWMLPGKP